MPRRQWLEPVQQYRVRPLGWYVDCGLSRNTRNGRRARSSLASAMKAATVSLMICCALSCARSSRSRLAAPSATAWLRLSHEIGPGAGHDIVGRLAGYHRFGWVLIIISVERQPIAQDHEEVKITVLPFSTHGPTALPIPAAWRPRQPSGFLVSPAAT